MKRLLIIYNPRSSRYAEIEQEILSRARELSGYLVGKYEVANTNIDDNVRQLSKLLKDGDLVLSAGGDATAIIAANIARKKSVVCWRIQEDYFAIYSKNTMAKTRRRTIILSFPQRSPTSRT
jgi:hypothetical protein